MYCVPIPLYAFVYMYCWVFEFVFVNSHQRNVEMRLNVFDFLIFMRVYVVFT